MKVVRSIVCCQQCFSQRFKCVCSPFVGDNGFDLRCMDCGQQTYVEFEFGNGDTHFEIVAKTTEPGEKFQ